MKKLSIIIPCYNEEKNIPFLLEDFNKFSKDYNFELIIVDNGSSDNTWHLLNKSLTRYNFLNILRIKKNIGYGHGILSGLSIANGEYLGWTHADLQTDIHDILRAYNILLEEGFPENIYVKGLRRKRNFTERIFTFGMSVYESTLFGNILFDINAQPNIFHKKFFKTWINAPENFLLDLYSYALAKKCKYKIKRFKVEWNERKYGTSAWNINWKSKFSFSFHILLSSIKLKLLLTKIKKGYFIK